MSFRIGSHLAACHSLLLAEYFILVEQEATWGNLVDIDKEFGTDLATPFNNARRERLIQLRAILRPVFLNMKEASK